MKDTLALALVRAELCRTYATGSPPIAAGRSGSALRRVITRTFRPFRRRKAAPAAGRRIDQIGE
jgi:hypothetical protein